MSRLLAFSHRESLEVLRDPVRLIFAFVGSVLLMLLFGYGMNTDVEDVRYAVLDLDQTPESRVYLQSLASSPYFREQAPIRDSLALSERMRANDISVAYEIPPGFGKDLKRGNTPTIAAWIEFIIGKQLPYIAIGMANFGLLTLCTIFIFEVPIKGDVFALVLGALLYVTGTTGLGLLISTFTSSQVAAVFGTASLVLLVGVSLSLYLVVMKLLQVPIAGSITLFLFGTTLYLFFATALGIFLGTIARSMAQFALLFIVTIMVIMLLSGGTTPIESQPECTSFSYPILLVPATLQRVECL